MFINSRITQSASAPNIKATTGTVYESYNQTPSYAMAYSGDAYCSPGNNEIQMGPGWSGALYIQSRRPNDVGFQTGLGYYAANQSVIDGTGYMAYLAMDASRSSSIYQNSAELKPINLAVRWFVRTF